MQEVAFYRNGLLEGELKRYYANGKMMQHGVYLKGSLIEPLRTFSEQGKVVEVMQPGGRAGS